MDTLMATAVDRYGTTRLELEVCQNYKVVIMHRVRKSMSAN